MKEELFICGATEDLTIDHHYPLSKGFKLTRDNAVLLCRSCNSAKRDILPDIWHSLWNFLDLVVNYGKRQEIFIEMGGGV